MATPKGLGRGLGALLGDFQEPAVEKSNYRTVPLHRIEPNPDQPRKDFDEEALQELSESISVHGLIQPLTVRETEPGYYQIIAGERRWRACRLAGVHEVQVVVLEADDCKAMELALIENLQRSDLNCIEEALGYQTLIDDFGLTQEDCSTRVGKSRSAVANALRLLHLPQKVLEMLRCGKLTAGHARAVLSLKNEKKQLEAAQKIAALGLSVRQAELLCRNLSQEKQPEPPKAALTVDYVAECEKTLSRALGRGVKIVNGKRKGKFELEFYGQDDLQALLDALMTLKGANKQ
ncbi:MAG: ParB/RepB/Spo0J family partition protein [Oscillospiraceae bacterium]|nr:ParB/RepB/Spo0J family partition protein [Oscillospiraceae bacterium]